MKIRNLLYFIIVIIGVIFLTWANANNLSKNIVVSNAWVQAMPLSQETSSAYMTIRNNAPKEAVIVSVSSDIAGVTEIHQMREMIDVMHMGMAETLHIPAQGKLTLQPGVGFHIMLINLKKPANKGDIVPVTLHFQDGSTVVVNAQVKLQQEEGSSSIPGMKGSSMPGTKG